MGNVRVQPAHACASIASAALMVAAAVTLFSAALLSPPQIAERLSMSAGYGVVQLAGRRAFLADGGRHNPRVRWIHVALRASQACTQPPGRKCQRNMFFYIRFKKRAENGIP